jgi:hypothetical protein
VNFFQEVQARSNPVSVVPSVSTTRPASISDGDRQPKSAFRVLPTFLRRDAARRAVPILNQNSSGLQRQTVGC